MTERFDMSDGLLNPESSDIEVAENSLGTFRIAKSEKRIEKMSDGTEREYRYVLGPVLIPNYLDLQKDWATYSEIEDGCHRFMSSLTVSDSHVRIVKSDAAAFVENYLMPVDANVGNLHIPRGTWMVAARVYDHDMIQKVDSGEYQGFSVEGAANHIERALPAAA